LVYQIPALVAFLSGQIDSQAAALAYYLIPEQQEQHANNPKNYGP